MEHRWGERILVDFPARVTAHRYAVRTGRLADLSVSGARVEVDFEARVLTRIQIAIVLPLWPKHHSPFIEAYVARKYKREFGIEWCEFAPAAVGELLRAIVSRPYSHLRRHAASASTNMARLSPPLLKHRA
ncbi:MAG: PilZ domain-containing protein [Steroidobacteraceae bacterium]